MIASNTRGPCTPLMRVISMSAVAEGPETNVVATPAVACNRATADFMISSSLMDGAYDRLVPDYQEYRRRKVG